MSKGPIWARILGLFGRFFGNFWNFWGKCSLLGRWAWARTKKIGKINKKLPNLGLNLGQGLCTCVVLLKQSWENGQIWGILGLFWRQNLENLENLVSKGANLAPKMAKFSRQKRTSLSWKMMKNE